MADGWIRNEGRMPPIMEGRRMAVKLFCGRVEGEKPVSNGATTGWPADGKQGPCWTISKPPHPYEIEFYRPL